MIQTIPLKSPTLTGKTKVDTFRPSIDRRFNAQQNQHTEREALILEEQRLRRQYEVENDCKRALPIDTRQAAKDVKNNVDIEEPAIHMYPRNAGDYVQEGKKEVRPDITTRCALSKPSGESMPELESRLEQEKRLSAELEAKIKSQDANIRSLREDCTKVHEKRMQSIDASDFGGGERWKIKYERLKELLLEHVAEKTGLQQRLEEAEDTIQRLQKELRRMKNDLEIKDDKISLLTNRVSLRDEEIEQLHSRSYLSSPTSGFFMPHAQVPQCQPSCRLGAYEETTAEQHTSPISMNNSTIQQVTLNHGILPSTQVSKSKILSKSTLQKKEALQTIAGKRPIWKP